LAGKAQISTQKRRTGVISPKRFIQKLKRDKEQFRSYDEHQARVTPVAIASPPRDGRLEYRLPVRPSR